MRIAFVSTLNTKWGGSEVLWIQSALLALERKYDVVVFVCEYQSIDHRIISLVEKGARLIIWPNNKIALQSSLIGKVKEFINYKIKLKLALNRFFKLQPDKILINQGDTFESSKNPMFFSICQFFKKKVSILAHANPEHLIMDYNSILKSRELISLINTFYFVSARNKETAEHQIACNINNSKIISNHPFLALSNYLSYPKNEIINFAFVARFDLNFKAQDLLVQVLAQPKWVNRNWHLNFYGEGGDEAILKDMVKYYGIHEKLTFHGHVSKINEIWELNNILLLPSIVEGYPLVVQEAMICGRPVFVTDIAGNAEHVTDNENGYIVDAPCLKLIDLKLEYAWQNKGNWEEMGKIANQTIKSKTDFHPDHTLLEDLLER